MADFRRSVVVVGLLLLVAAPIDGDRSLGSPAMSGRTRSVPCPIEVPEVVDVECGELVVPEDYEQPEGDEVRLPYVILRSRSSDPEPDPVLYTAGGPGFSSLGSVWRFAGSALLDDRDVIVFEQRGNRHATPALLCDPSVWWEEEPGHTPCLDHLRAMGVDLAQYSTDNIVRDVLALRRALGYEQWNLSGSSFSTSVMLLAMGADPGGTRAAILESVKPPSETVFAHRADSPLRATERMIADCEADRRCAVAYPDLADDFFALIRDLNEQPIEMDIEVAADADPRSTVLDGDRFVDWIALDQLYQPIFADHDPAYLPLVVDEALRGNFGPLEVAARDYWTSIVLGPDWAWGLMFAVNCQQDVPAAGPSRSEGDLAASERLDGFARSETQLAICDAWDLPPLPPAATAYVQSDVPTLVLAGSHDPVTPPAWGRRTAEHLSHSTYVEFPGYGHDVTGDNSCAATLESRFLDDPSRDLDTSCVDDARGPEFVLPDDVYRAPGVHRSAGEVSLGAAGGVAWVEAVALLSIYGALLATVVLVIGGLVWLVRRARHRTGLADRTALLAYALACSAGVATIAVMVLLDRVTDVSAGLSPLASYLGPRRDLVSANLLAWIAPLGGLVVVTLTGAVAWAWFRRRWSLSFRLLTTVSAVCSLGMVTLGVRWGLFTMLL